MLILAFFTVSAIVCWLLAAFHGMMYLNASAINDDFDAIPGPGLPYDLCTVPFYKADPEKAVTDVIEVRESYLDFCAGDEERCDRGTLWTELWMYNAMLFVAMSLNFVL